MNTNNITIQKSFCAKKDFYSTLSLFDDETTFKNKLMDCQLQDNIDRKIRYAKECSESFRGIDINDLNEK